MSHSAPSSSAKQAFSLVELAIVLVILGLLVGGVLSGRSLIHASQLRTVSTQHANYLTAFLSFRDKYLALPGDIPNATEFWGAHDPDHGTCLMASGTGTNTLTCNGNGDGNVDAVDSFEMYRAWNHLSNARLIEGSYTGTGWGGGASMSLDPAQSPPTIPKGKLREGVWCLLRHSGAQIGSSSMFAGDYGRGSFTYASLVDSGLRPTGRVMTPEEVWNIDNKLDDGKPARGKVVTGSGGGVDIINCTDAVDENSLDANYLLTSGEVNCAIIFRQHF